MGFFAEIQSPAFWTGLLTIIWINVILSGDNAVVIALAARSLPKHQQQKAVFWGAGAAVVMRVVLTVGAVELLKLPYLKIVGGLLLLWIAVRLLLPEDDDSEVKGSGNLLQAIKTILVADVVMSLDNVLAVAAVAKDSIVLLILGLGLSIPLVIFGATFLMKLMVRYPIIITIGAALLGWVAGDMLISDPILTQWVAEHAKWMHFRLPEFTWTEIAGAILVVMVGKWLGKRAEDAKTQFEDLATRDQAVRTDNNTGGVR
jgi:YjbE family integral membrane protein